MSEAGAQRAHTRRCPGSCLLVAKFNTTSKKPHRWPYRVRLRSGDHVGLSPGAMTSTDRDLLGGKQEWPFYISSNPEHPK